MCPVFCHRLSLGGLEFTPYLDQVRLSLPPFMVSARHRQGLRVTLQNAYMVTIRPQPQVVAILLWPPIIKDLKLKRLSGVKWPDPERCIQTGWKFLNTFPHFFSIFSIWWEDENSTPYKYQSPLIMTIYLPGMDMAIIVNTNPKSQDHSKLHSCLELQHWKRGTLRMQLTLKNPLF